MYSGKRQKREQGSEQSFRSSRFGYANEEESKFVIKNELIDNINARLAQNFNQIVELFNQRKGLLLKKLERMYEDNDSRIEAISRGRMQDLRNEARLLRDDNVTALIDNADKLNSTKNLLKRIIEQHNFVQFEGMQKAKGKAYHDKLKQAEKDLNNKTKKYGILLEQLEKINERERNLFSQIQQLQTQMINVLRKKESDYLRKADMIQEEIDRRKAILRENKSSSDKKKKDIENTLMSYMETINAYETYTFNRNNDIEGLFGGNQNLDDFEKFLRQFEALIELKVEGRKDERKDRAVSEIIRIANSYEAYIQQFNKERQSETIYLEDVNEGLKNQVKVALIEKTYFLQITQDKTKLGEILKKCKAYKSLLDNFEGDRLKISKDFSKIAHMKSTFMPKLKFFASQSNRRQQLKKELALLLGALTELQSQQKRYKDNEYANHSYLLARQSIEREMDELAQRGNLNDYKQKLKELERIDRDLQNNRDVVSVGEYQKLEGKLNAEAQLLHAKYGDLIDPILVENEPMPTALFLSKLSKRLALL